MRRILHASILAPAALCILGALIGCKPESQPEEAVLRVGIIASLEGPARPWGLVTVRCAQVVADYHNERGGFDLDGRKVMIELIVRDDRYDAREAAKVAEDFARQGIDYVIGPLGDAQVSSSARILDSAGIFYVHYGFNLSMLSADSLGVLGMPLPEQSLPVLFEHLKGIGGVETVLVMSHATEEGIREKSLARQLVADSEFEQVRLSRFDVAEETFDQKMSAKALEYRVDKIVQLAPDALVLVGCPPELFVDLGQRLREGGYAGFICSQNFQDPELFAEMGPAADGIFYVGGTASGQNRNEYYDSLRDRYVELAGSWSGEADTKLYALDFIIACLREAGDAALEKRSAMYGVLETIQYEDPFCDDGRLIHVSGGGEDPKPYQMHTPIRISKISNGEPHVAREMRPESP